MRRVARLLPLLALLASCVDFVDPAGLGLARETAIELSFDLSTDPLRASCAAPGQLPEDAAVLCVVASVAPGVTPLGEGLRVLDDTLRILGSALGPAVDAGGVLRYAAAFVLPNEGLESVPFTASLPRVEGAEAWPGEIRWFALGRAGPDTLVREPGGGVRLRVDLPGGVSSPAPGGQPFWRADVYGDTATVTFTGSGLPRPVFDFPHEVLSALGGSRFRAQVAWNRSLSAGVGNVRLLVRFNERIGWAVVTEAAPDGPAAGG